MIETAPEIGQSVVEELDDMEMIENDGGIGKMFLHGTDVGRRHVDGHRLDFCPGTLETFPERRSVSPPAVADKDDSPCVQIHDDGEIAVTAAYGDLVDGQMLQPFEARPGKMGLQVFLLNLLDHILTDSQVTGRILQGHVPGKLQGIPFEGPGIALPGIGKPNPDHDGPYHRRNSKPLNGQNNPHRFLPDGQRPKPPLHTTTANHMTGPAHGTANLPLLLSNPEYDTSVLIMGTDILVAPDAETMIQKTRGHDGIPP